MEAKESIITLMDESCKNCELRTRPDKCDYYSEKEAFDAIIRRGLCFEAVYNNQQGIRSEKGFQPYNFSISADTLINFG